MKKSTVTIKNNNAVFVAKSNNESNSISDLQISINVFFFLQYTQDTCDPHKYT